MKGPWRVHPKSGHVCIDNGPGNGCTVIADVCGIVGDKNPNAHLIVKAVNHHDKLAALLEQITGAAEEVSAVSHGLRLDAAMDSGLSALWQAQNAARALLAKMKAGA